MLDEFGITQRHQRIIAWFAFTIAAIAGYSLAGWSGALLGVLGVPIIALAGAAVLAAFFGALSLLLDGVAWMFGCEMDGWAFKKIRDDD